MLATETKTIDKLKVVHFNRQRMEEALSSGKAVKLPKGLSREEKRQFILNN
jgi:hypothetical protein